ncbi:MAG: prepilin-type N-terminal cleavage/methylation domain-containing protein [Lentisphaeria bacterium]|nr:prepilin-type N-terminal cleavage/methylation domain-containing protein [Lentisphaeria bacterium]
MKKIDFKSKKKSCFTLIELMVVIVIMAIITGITLPSITKLMSGSGVTIGANLVSSKLRLARSTALAKRQRVALICPDGASLKEDNPNAYRSCRLAIVSSRDNSGNKMPPGVYNFKYWVSADSWDFLTPGVYVRFDETIEPPTVEGIDLKTLGGGRSETSYALVFAPAGRPASSDGGNLANGQFMKIEIGEGYFEQGKLNNKSNPKNYLKVGVDAYVGRVETFQPKF